MIIQRQLTPTLLEFAKHFPAVAILGPRQSGKTTLAKQAFPQHRYVSFEALDVRTIALTDPRGYLKSLENEHGVILDEFQHVPTILSYIQLIIDQEYKPGYFILTSSQNFLLNQAISQTLAGRIGILTLLPLSIEELAAQHLLPEKFEELIFKGGYPRIYSQHFTPAMFYPSYLQTYIERDVRNITQITDLSLFQKFIQLCAGRIGQILNISSLANDCGITSNTAKAWLSILESSYIIFLLQPYHNNFSKRLIKSPKLYFYDTGIACSLLAIDSEKQIYSHYLKGGLFESLIISELLKYFFNLGRKPHIYFWRESHGNEIDCIIQSGSKIIPIEIKSGQTITPDYFKGINYWHTIDQSSPGYIIYGDTENYQLKQGNIVSWKSINRIFNDFE